eukprot:TRINITY_DN28234_c0_g4_i2.p1 TRINITY_DN28234_c0_g4~~TRINITY_DN28234_c0_g4_i2.p1  ORF type:complete len:410 (+),score=50.17 TRINITY_DN28234_c0_g4_i2:216-1445(+)
MLIVGGAFAWGLLTLLLAFVMNFHMMMLLRALNGVALGTLMPVSQSLVAHMTQPSERGFFFGGFHASLNVGAVLSAVMATSISQQTLWGYWGWQIAFVGVALASFAIAVFVQLFLDNPMPECRPPRQFSVLNDGFLGSFGKLQRYCRIPSFRVIVVQGLFGSIPWSALTFLIMYYQLIGMSDYYASLLFVTSIIGGAFGGVLGGQIGDWLTRWSPFHGRPLTAQISVISGIPLITAVLVFVPPRPSSYNTYLALMFVFGLCATWCAVGVNRPILTELVGVRDRASIIAWVVALDGAFAAVCGAPVVGILAEEFFNYRPSTEHVADMPASQRLANASALSSAMLFCTIGPWVICFVCYTFLHWTYGPDISGDLIYVGSDVEPADDERESDRPKASTGLLTPEQRKLSSRS